jgi:hypothetical protein
VPVLGPLTTIGASLVGVGAVTIALHRIWRGAAAAPPEPIALLPVENLRASA